MKSHPKSVFAIVSSLVLALPAHASSDHFVESQVSATRLAELLRTHFQTESAFCPEAVTCPDTGGTCFVDRIEYPSAGTWSRGGAVNVPINDYTSLPSTEIFYSQPVTVQLKTTDCAYRAGCETTTPFAATLEVVLNTVDEDALCFAPQRLQGLPVDVETPAPFCLPVDLEALAVLTGSESSSVTGKAVSLAADGARLGVRFELDRDRTAYDATRIDAWREFIGGRLGPASGTSDWSAFAHESLLRQATQATVEAAFAADRDLELRGVPTVAWTGLGSAGGSIDLSVDAEYDGCVDLSPVTVSALAKRNRASDGVEVGGTIDWDVDEWDAVRCGFQSGFVIGAIAGPLVAASIGLDDLGQSFGWCEVTGDDTFVCDQKSHPRFLALGHAASVQSTLGAVYGHPSGLELSGDLLAVGGAVPSVEASLQTPTFGIGRDDGECGYFGGVDLSGSGAVCDVEFTDDRLDLFDVVYPETLTLPASLAITVDPPSDRAKQDYIAAPYGMKVTVFSASGIHTWQLSPSTLLPADDESLLCRVGTVRDQATGCLEPAAD